MSSWFSTWFDSDYYHLLYQHRNDIEAQFFMNNLIEHLGIRSRSKILDLACGKGRHSIYLADKGFDVIGVDLSPESIGHAKQFEQKKLHFYTHDMRKELNLGQFDFIFNLFTSFGYFNSEKEHIDTLRNIRNCLKSNDSILVIDFFNALKTIKELVLSEKKVVSDITFNINRYVENGYILKNIRFEDKAKSFYFQERVRAFLKDDFERLLKEVDMQLINTYGDYDLSEFNKQKSNRLILIAKPC
ncbi:MAG: class I SAM-dependent methyltransferase [Saprospiraceae bacterium]|nr:class I SAM-dependent methyltransferase [Saprospiraceae bacterium]